MRSASTIRVLLAAAVLLAGCTAGTADAERLGAAFCTAVIARDEAAATAMMSVALQGQIAALRAYDAQFRQQRPGDTPPLGDGLRLTAFPDAVTDCRVTVETPLQLIVHHRATGDVDARSNDRLLLVRDAKGDLRVGDIAFASDNRVRLRGWLNEAMTE